MAVGKSLNEYLQKNVDIYEKQSRVFRPVFRFSISKNYRKRGEKKNSLPPPNRRTGSRLGQEGWESVWQQVEREKRKTYERWKRTTGDVGGSRGGGAGKRIHDYISKEFSRCSREQSSIHDCEFRDTPFPRTHSWTHIHENTPLKLPSIRKSNPSENQPANRSNHHLPLEAKRGANVLLVRRKHVALIHIDKYKCTHGNIPLPKKRWRRDQSLRTHKPEKSARRKLHCLIYPRRLKVRRCKILFRIKNEIQ